MVNNFSIFYLNVYIYLIERSYISNTDTTSNYQRSTLTGHLMPVDEERNHYIENFNQL